MPTFYNFSNNPNLFQAKFPNISNAQGFATYGPRSTFVDDVRVTWTVQSLSAAQRPPSGTETVCRVVMPAYPNISTTYICSNTSTSQNGTPTGNDIDYCESPRTYNWSAWVRGVSYTPGTTVKLDLEFRDLYSNGTSTAGTGNIVATLDGTWQQINGTAIITSSSNVIKGGYYFCSFSCFCTPILTSFPGLTVDIADLTLTSSLHSGAERFDDQFIPADTFRQGNLWAWGSNYRHGLGTLSLPGGSPNTGNIQSTPIIVNSYSKWKNLQNGSDGPQHFAIDSDGYLWFWGGYLSTAWPTTTSTGLRSVYSTPTISSLSGRWKQVSRSGGSGSYTGVGIKIDGTLWTWGYNAQGQLGINTNVDSQTLVQEFTSSTNWKSISGGVSHIAAIKTDGTLWTWGYNYNGQLGTNDIVSRSTPVQEFTSSNNWKEVSCLYKGTCAIKTDGTMWMWGSTEFSIGQTKYAGPGTILLSTPSQELTFRTDWKTVNCSPQFGYHGGIALTNSGVAYRFGYLPVSNSGGNATPSIDVFAQEPGKVWKKSHCGRAQYLIATDGTLWGLGANGYANLGVNDTVFRSTPVQITTYSKFKEIVRSGFSVDTIHAIQYIDPII